VDLYIRYNNVPDLWQYDYRDTSTKLNFTISINEPSLGVWYLGFYGYRLNSTFSFVVSNSNECPSNCSNHGICRGLMCQCQSEFNGAYCQNMVSTMTLGASYPGYVDSNSWNFYSVQAQSENTLIISVHELNEGDCDVYVKQGSQPSKSSYDYKDLGTASTFQITVPTPTGTWFIGVYGYRTCSYTVTVNLQNTCPGNPPCSGHGDCTSSGLCQCNSGYAGLNCSLPVVSLSSGATLTGLQVALNGWNYYALSVVNSSFVSVGIKETSTIGYLWLFTSKGQMPDLRNYEFQDQDTNSKYHHVHMEFSEPQSDTWIIGVYANPFATGTTVQFSLSAWYSPF